MTINVYFNAQVITLKWRFRLYIVPRGQSTCRLQLLYRLTEIYFMCDILWNVGVNKGR